MKTQKAWSEIFKAVEKQATIVLEVLDAHDPEGTRPREIERILKERFPDKKLILVLNKSDLISREILKAWLRYYQNLGHFCFYASALKKDGINFLRSQIIRHRDREHGDKIIVVGYPNVGKSSIITALLKDKKIAPKSPEAGFTRGIQLLKIPGWKDTYLLDTPGVVPYDEDLDEIQLALKGAITASKIRDPQAVFEEIFQRCVPEELKTIYGVEFADSDDFTEALGRKRGILKKGALVNEPQVWSIVVRDWQRNKIPYYVMPPNYSQESNEVRKNKDFI